MTTNAYIASFRATLDMFRAMIRFIFHIVASLKTMRFHCGVLIEFKVNKSVKMRVIIHLCMFVMAIQFSEVANLRHNSVHP